MILGDPGQRVIGARDCLVDDLVTRASAGLDVEQYAQRRRGEREAHEGEQDPVACAVIGSARCSSEPARTVDFRAARCASATASRYPCGAHRAATSCVLGARCAVRADFSSLEAGCLSISWLYSVAAQPFDAQQLL